MNQLLQRSRRYKHLIVGVAALSAFLLYVVPFDAIYAELTGEQLAAVQNRIRIAHEQVDNTAASDSRKALEHQRINDQLYAILSARGNIP